MSHRSAERTSCFIGTKIRRRHTTFGRIGLPCAVACLTCCVSYCCRKVLQMSSSADLGCTKFDFIYITLRTRACRSGAQTTLWELSLRQVQQALVSNHACYATSGYGVLVTLS